MHITCVGKYVRVVGPYCSSSSLCLVSEKIFTYDRSRHEPRVPRRRFTGSLAFTVPEFFMSWTPLPDIDTAPLNRFLLENDLRIVDNPCVSPDFCLDWPALSAKLKAGGSTVLQVFAQSTVAIASGSLTLAQDSETGDHAWLLESSGGSSDAVAKRAKAH